jgi:hypothetical protein
MVTVFSIIAPAHCEIHMALALPVGDLSVRMRNDRHEPNGAEKQRPERIPVDPRHRSSSRNATGAAVAIDPQLQNCRRLKHHYARNRHFGAGLRVTGDMLTVLEIFRHRSFSFPRSPGNAHRSIGMRAWFTHPFIKVT